MRIFRRAGDNLLNVVNDILDFSKVEAGHIELESIAFDLADVLEKAIEVAAVRSALKGARTERPDSAGSADVVAW